MKACSKTGINMTISTPLKQKDLQQSIITKAKEIAKSNNAEIVITDEVSESVKDADVVVTDTWMSYHIPEKEKENRVKMFLPYQVNKKIMDQAKNDAIFMHCLPAKRGYEVTNDVIDGIHSVVFDEAENRMWTEMAILLYLMDK